MERRRVPILSDAGMTTSQWKEWAEKNFKDRAPEALKLYPGSTDDASTAVRDRHRGRHVDRVRHLGVA